LRFSGTFSFHLASGARSGENLVSKVPSFRQFSSRCKKVVDWIRILSYSQAVNNLDINFNGKGENYVQKFMQLLQAANRKKCQRSVLDIGTRGLAIVQRQDM